MFIHVTLDYPFATNTARVHRFRVNTVLYHMA